MHLTVGWLSKSHVVRVSNVSFRQRLEYFNVVSFQAPRLVLVVGREGNHRSPSLDPRNSSASSAIGCRPEWKASQPYLVDVLRLVLTHRFQLHYSVSRLFYLRRAPNHTSPVFYCCFCGTCSHVCQKDFPGCHSETKCLTFCPKNDRTRVPRA